MIHYKLYCYSVSVHHLTYVLCRQKTMGLVIRCCDHLHTIVHSCLSLSKSGLFVFCGNRACCKSLVSVKFFLTGCCLVDIKHFELCLVFVSAKNITGFLILGKLRILFFVFAMENGYPMQWQNQTVQFLFQW